MRRQTLTARPQLVLLEARDVPSFLPPVSYANGNYGVTIADLDHDGHRDLVSATGNICIRFGDGTGILGTAICYGTPAISNDVRAADVNLDGSPDLVVGTYGKVEVLLNNGDGTFGSPSEFQAGHWPWHVTVKELNGDGKPDIAASNFDGGLQILFGNGDGMFQSASFFDVGATTTDVEGADFNGDGWNDLSIDNGLGKSVSVFLNRGDGTFKPKVDYSVTNQPWGHELGDVNKDNQIDLVVANGGNTVSVLLGNGDGTFQPPLDYSSGGVIAVFPVIVDFNKDRKPDIAVAHYYAHGGAQPASVLLGNGDGTFKSSQDFIFGTSSTGVAAGDLNNDRFPDLVVGDKEENKVHVFMNDGVWTAPIPQPGPGRLSDGIGADQAPINAVVKTPAEQRGPSYAVVDGSIDMGAFEAQSSQILPVTPPSSRADLDFLGIVLATANLDSLT